MNSALQTPPELPDSVEQCHALIEAQAGTINQLSTRVEQLLRRLFGTRSERLDPDQLTMFAEAWAAENAAPTDAAEEEPAAEAKTKKKKGHGRKPLPENLPRKRVEHDVKPEEKVCAECGTEKQRIGETLTEQLEYVPASFYVIEHAQLKYACKCCQEGVVVGEKPAQPIEKSLAAPGLLAHVITAKYCDHLPLHRQEGIFKRHGVDLSRKTLCDWVIRSAFVLEPVVQAMAARVLQSKVIHTDDTPVQVQDPDRKGKTRRGRMWPYVGDADHPYTIFDYTPGRERAGPEEFLRNFTGEEENPRYIQCDAYAGYNGLFAKGRHVREVACWAHARRKYDEARTSDPVRAHQALLRIQEFYRVEAEIREAAAGLPRSEADALRHARRREEARPLLDDFETWARDALANQVLPKSDIGRAFAYSLNQWDALKRYTEDPALNIDNNTAERAIRAIAVGRKNWLFLGSDDGGRAAAIHFSLIASAKRHGLDPFAYLRDLLRRIPTHPNRDIQSLFPDRWANTTD
jgi:transposase